MLLKIGSGDLGPNRVVERPKVIQNSSGKWVMWMHIDDSSYGEAKVGVATSDSICGTYSYQRSFQPFGRQSRDMGLFKDTDGSGYLLTEDRQSGLRIIKLTSDFMNVASDTYLFPSRYEAPAMIKVNGRYFMFASQLTGWDTNDNKYTTSTSLTGGWSSWANFAPAGERTYDSQTTFILQVGSNYMYMGDRWFSSNLMRSSYIWLPLTINGSSASITWYINWIIDPSSGSARVGPSETSYEGEAASMSGGAKSVSCSGCSGSSAAGYIGATSGSGGTIRWSSVSSTASTLTTLRFKHQNGDAKQRFAVVTVNGQSQTVAFLPSTDGNTPASSAVTVSLNSGSSNVITVSGTGSGWGPDIDRVMVPVS
ncbi:SubName: Full=Related to glycosyl hydrolase family 43 protein-Neosartorya fischeri {ECO:0000313/EMBL:CCA72743.1} [Serendipita indica DSM 11827]|uniref:Related to glycosyl hydrolase family 43 protein-Neosartorya fischeri n=1 Tax=Serendipita indica (strain DSM 11827) TaxID=1109443 RepID=G4TN50_SERID|nr:SubName: Full=Related to glycosyl hydrolase family 43 protein-Neosartorya fischeri {ECO:0000313/EMBL:CCA72743.1} [Serendipita indica DSM 11827]CCA72743.1 related to glycosyl hydrolase family 43 protein-Neosartorya fischeri [Serendipita indica DSM 11827]